MDSSILGNNSFNNAEYFKGGRGGGGGSTGSGIGAVLAGGAAGSMSNSGSNTVQRCPLDDQSFYCQMARTTNIVGMALYLFVVLMIVIAFLYYVYKYFSSKKSTSGKK